MLCPGAKTEAKEEAVKAKERTVDGIARQSLRQSQKVFQRTQPLHEI